MATLQKITPCLWFENQAEEAAEYYTSIFKKARIVRKSYYGKEGVDVHKKPEGTVLTVEFEIEGQPFVALNGGPEFKFNEALSLMVGCQSQEEIDYFWEKLSAGGDPASQVCGWLKDKYGLSWQVVPTLLAEMMADEDRERADRVMKVMMRMKKINIEELKKAYREEALV